MPNYLLSQRWTWKTHGLGHVFPFGPDRPARLLRLGPRGRRDWPSFFTAGLPPVPVGNGRFSKEFIQYVMTLTDRIKGANQRAMDQMPWGSFSTTRIVGSNGTIPLFAE